jgi:cation transport ATPase
LGKHDNDYEELLHEMESKINKKSKGSRRFKEDKALREVELETKPDDDYVSDDTTVEEDEKAYRKASKKELKKQRKEEKKAEKRKKKKRHIIRKIFLAFFILLLIAIIVFAIFIVKNGGGLKGILTTIVGSDAEQVANLEDLTFLAVGKSQGMTDTIMVMKYSPKNQTLSMVSIQRDTYTGSNDATATASDKINAK